MTRSAWLVSALIVAAPLAISACQGSSRSVDPAEEKPTISAAGLNETPSEIALQEALETLPSHQSKQWEMPDRTSSGFVTPLRSFKIKTGHYCRDFMQTVSSNGEIVSTQGTACRTDDGRWLVVTQK